MKKYFITGLIILLPVALTFMVIVFLFDLFTDPFVPLISMILTWFEGHFAFTLPKGLALFISRFFALIFLCIFILFLGALARWFLTRNLVAWGNKILSRTPLIKSIYNISRDIFSALFSGEGKKAFKYPVILPFPGRPSFSMGFQAGEVAQEVQAKVAKPLISVFMPTAPHPISGFLFFAAQKDVYKIEMTNEEAVKFLVSCGMIHTNATKVKLDGLL